jgi:hypothetical protein
MGEGTSRRVCGIACPILKTVQHNATQRNATRVLVPCAVVPSHLTCAWSVSFCEEESSTTRVVAERSVHGSWSRVQVPIRFPGQMAGIRLCKAARKRVMAFLEPATLPTDFLAGAIRMGHGADDEIECVNQESFYKYCLPSTMSSPFSVPCPASHIPSQALPVLPLEAFICSLRLYFAPELLLHPLPVAHVYP